MKNIIKYSWVLALLFSLGACNLGEFDEDITKNPNAVTTPYTGNLLTGVLTGWNTLLATTPLHYVQHIANSQYTTSDQYGDRQFNFSGFYAGRLADLQRIILMNQNEDTKDEALAYGLNENQIAVAQILQSYWYLHMTDRWGPIPYSQALKGLEGETVLPAFDTQQSIYNSLFSTLKSAHDALTGSTDPDLGKGDILFGGDIDMWRKFANTIRMTAALRISEVDNPKGNSEFNSAINAGVIESDVYYDNIGGNFQNSWFNRFQTRRDFALANTLVHHMEVTSYEDPVSGDNGVLDVARDPRLPIYGDPIEDSQGGTPVYHGVPYGAENSADLTGGNSFISFFGSTLRDEDDPTYIYTMAQVHFSMAEAALKGWITDDAQTHYEAGIMASMNQYGVEATDAAEYMTNTWVAYDNARAWEQIMTQKWLANFSHGYEAWADWRRTGFPVLEPAEDPLNFDEGGTIPVRQAYGSNTRDLNTANWEAAVASLGGNDWLNVNLWWDVN